ncbi:MAG: hypothetical protein R3Y33_00020 [Clostridia bacterium]
MSAIIRERTEAKEFRMSKPLVMTKDQWLERGGVYHGSLGEASRQNYFTARCCEKMGKPVTDEEFAKCIHFAMFRDCYAFYLFEQEAPTSKLLRRWWEYVTRTQKKTLFACFLS